MSNENPTPDEVRASIVPKSDQLNADDLLLGPITVTITKVRRGDKEQPIVVEVEGHQPYKPCKTMRRILIAAFSDDPKHWVGQQMTLYCDPDVMWAGVKVGGIRISHLSGLDEPRTFMLTKSRGKRSEVTIHPIKPIATKAQTDGPDVPLDKLTALKKSWASPRADELKGKSQAAMLDLFSTWVLETVAEDSRIAVPNDVDDFRRWTTADLAKCQEALG